MGAVVLPFGSDPWTFRRLPSIFDGRTNVYFLDKAVCVQSGVVPFFRDKNFLTSPGLRSLGSALFPQNGDAQDRIDVEVVQFVSFIRDQDQDVVMLKRDVEGAKVDILDAPFSTGHISRFRDVVVGTLEFLFSEFLERT